MQNYAILLAGRNRGTFTHLIRKENLPLVPNAACLSDVGDVQTSSIDVPTGE